MKHRSQSKRASEGELFPQQNTGFTVLGAVLCLAAAYALVELLRRNYRIT